MRSERSVRLGVAAELVLEACLPLSSLNLGDAEDLGVAECNDEVGEGDAEVDFGGLAIRISCSDSLSDCLQAAHLCLAPAQGVVSPQRFRNARPSCQLVRKVSFLNLSHQAVLFQRPALLTGSDTWGGSESGNRDRAGPTRPNANDWRPTRAPVGWTSGAFTSGPLCQRGRLNRTVTNRQNWIAASEKVGGRPAYHQTVRARSSAPSNLMDTRCESLGAGP
mgnify:CR=1 FL=1